MQLVDVVGCGIARITDEQESSLANLAELLRSPGTPLHHGAAFEPKPLEQIVGRLGCAGVRAGKNF